MHIENPILRGFNPDLSIVRLGEDYYTPCPHLSGSLGYKYIIQKTCAWELIGQVLTNTAQLDLRGVPDSCGFGRPVCPTTMAYFIWSTPCKIFDGVWLLPIFL